MATGRIQCLLISTKSGEVVYERFFDSFTESEKGGIRAAFHATADADNSQENYEYVGRHKNGKIVVIPSGDLLFCGIGTGEYNELAVSEVLRLLISVYKDVFRVPSLSDTVFFQNYAQTMLVIDEVCKEGLVEHLDKASLQKALAFKVPVFSDGSDKKGGLMARFSAKQEMKIT